jgi:PAS domain S-box-containing protein
MINKNDLKELLNELRSSVETANDRVGCLKKFSEIENKVETFLNNQNDNLEYKNFFSSSLELFCVVNRDGSFELINPTFSKVLGFSEERILATPFSDFIHPDDLEATVAKVGELMAGIPSVDFENRYRKIDGTYLSLIWTCTINTETGKMYAIARDFTIQKKVELSTQHSLLNALMESIPDLIFYKDLDGVYVDCNNAFEKFINKDKLDIIGKTDFDIFEDHDLAKFFREKDELMLSSGKSLRNEEWVVYPCGKKVLLDTLKTPYLCSDNKPLGLIGISRDITDKKAVEVSLVKNKERLDLAIKGANDGLWDWNLVTNDIYFSPRWKSIIGYKDNEIVNSVESFFALVHPDDRDEVQCCITNYLEGKIKKYEVEFRMLSKKEGYKTILSRANTVLNSEKIADRMIGTHVDITVRIANEKKIKRQAVLLCEIQKVTGLGIWQKDMVFNKTTWSDQMYAIFGVEKEHFDVSFDSYIQMVHPEDINLVKDVGENVDADLSNLSYVQRIIRPNGEIRFLQTWLTVTVDAKNVPVLMNGACLDITEQKLVKENLLDALFDGQAKERKRISQDLHDGLGQLLSAIKLNLYGLKSEINEVMFSQLISVADRAIKEYRAVAHNLASPSLEKLGLRETLKVMCADLNKVKEINFLFKSKNIELKLSEKIEIELYRISQELVNNILKYSLAKNVTIILEILNKELVLEVKDDGVGFDKVESKINNSGIGLDNINSRVSFLNGDFIINTSIGGGTSAKIILPQKSI